MQAPTVTTTIIVPKNTDGEAVWDANANGATTPAKIRANDSPKKWPRPRNAVGNCSDRYTRTAGKHDSTVKPVINAPTLHATVALAPIRCAVIISKSPG